MILKIIQWNPMQIQYFEHICQIFIEDDYLHAYFEESTNPKGKLVMKKNAYSVSILSGGNFLTIF